MSTSTNPTAAAVVPRSGARVGQDGALAGLRAAYGGTLTAVILALVGLWTFGMIVAPQAFMIDRSLWTREQPADSYAITQRIDQLYGDVDILGFDVQDLEAAPPGPEQERNLAAKRAEIASKRAEIARLETTETTPVKAYTLANYGRMSGLHLRVFVKTIAASALVTLVALVVCYPIAYAAARARTRFTATLLLLGLVVPYAINELLRVFAWLMILDRNGLMNGLLGIVGLGPVDFVGTSVGVFLALVYAYVLFMVFPIMNAIGTLDSNQIEAARDLGAGRLRIHRRVVIPHAKPGIAVGCVMTFMLAAGSYAVPQIITRGQGGDWFSQLIYRQFFESNDWNTGAAYSLSLLLACVLFVVLVMALFRVGVRDIAR